MALLRSRGIDVPDMTPTSQSSPPAPPHLSPAARSVWEQVAEPRHTATALVVVEAYSVQVARMRDAQGRIDAEGLIITGPKGAPVPHPALAIERAASAEAERLRQDIVSINRSVGRS